MTIKVAINGYGRIGRNIMRALYELGRTDEISIVAINDLGDANSNAHLTRYDTAHGKFPGTVSVDDGDLVVNGDRIKVFAERDPSKLPWAELGVDLVMECTGFFRSRETAGAHITAGAKKVIVSAPGQNVDNTVVYGVNHDSLKSSDLVISNASCTTNCLAPLAKTLNDAIGIERGIMTTIHSYTGDQPMLDRRHNDLYRARAAAMAMIPTSTGAAKALGEVLPELAGKLDGTAMRVPTPNVSAVDLTFEAAKNVTVEEVNAVIEEAAAGHMGHVLSYDPEPKVSIDFNHTPYSTIFAPDQTKVIGGRTVRVLAWYDNEWGFSCRMADVAATMGQLLH